jgi:hypothetical protein
MDASVGGSTGPTYLGGARSITYTSGADLLSTGVGSTAVPVNGLPASFTSSGRRIKFNVAVNTAVQMFVRVDANNILLNDGVPIPVDTAYDLGVDLPIGTVFTIRFSASCTVRWITVKEGA